MTPVWLDCDPGFDDLVTWLLLESAPGVNLVGVSASAGNAPLENTLDNALRAAAFFDLPQPVYKGRERALNGTLTTSQHLLGPSGLSSVGLTLPPTSRRVDPTPMGSALSAQARRAPGELTLVATGPLTSVAVAFMLDPELPRLLREVLWMGGSSDRGNHTAAAEFNAFFDPEAAELVFQSEAKVVMFGLNLTWQVEVTPRHLERLRALPGERAALLADHLEFYLCIRGGVPAPMPFHDPVTAMYLLHPALFGLEDAHVGVELSGVLTRGMTVCEFRVPRKATANARVATAAAGDEIMGALMTLLEGVLLRGG